MRLHAPGPLFLGVQLRGNEGYPPCHQIQTSIDGAAWKSPVATGQGTSGLVTIAFAPVQAKFVRISQTAAPDVPAFWSMQTLKVFVTGTR